MTKLVRNCDNDGLDPWGNEHLINGFVDEVNGPGAAEVPEFVPTRHELVQLMKYWLKEGLRLEFHCLVYGQSGSYELQVVPFAYRRVDRIAKCLGDAVVKEAEQEILDEFVKTVDARHWQVFLHGTREEVAALHLEVQQKMTEVDEAPRKDDEEAN